MIVVTPVLTNIVLLKFQENHGRNPQGTTSKQDIDDLIQIRDEVFESPELRGFLPDDFARYKLNHCSEYFMLASGPPASSLAFASDPLNWL